ncbi:acetyltransferase [Salmonella enterica subsp. enterica serovar Typhimurium]|nr:acetyltransferase [Salmonella enterica subsp. enterica serovar Typhimurium]
MLIRVEIPIDAPGIDALLRRSFESDAEAKLVHDLREDGFLTLGLVARMMKVRWWAMSPLAG